MHSSTLFWGVIWGSIGLGYFVYGKKQKALVPFVSGIGLIALPYFSSNQFFLIILGIILAVLPFVIKR